MTAYQLARATALIAGTAWIRAMFKSLRVDNGGKRDHTVSVTQ